MTAPFISSADLAAYVRSDALDSDLALIALDAACATVRTYCDQNLEATTETDAWLDGNGGTTLLLPAFPVSAASSCSVYSDRTDTTPEVLVLNTDYVLNGQTGALYRIDGGVFTAGRQNVKVTYTYGATTVPADVRLIALQIAARIYEVGIVKTESVGGVSATYLEGAGQLNADERHALRGYRR